MGASVVPSRLRSARLSWAVVPVVATGMCLSAAPAMAAPPAPAEALVEEQRFPSGTPAIFEPGAVYRTPVGGCPPAPGRRRPT